MRLFLASLISILYLTACSQNTPERQIEVDSLYINGTIWAGKELPSASVLAIKDKQIAFIGNEIPENYIFDKEIDLDGRFLMPGFMDNHVHFFEGGSALASVDLRDADTPEEFIRRLKDYSEKLPDDRWILNGNWDHTLWGGELPDRNWIDSFTADRPVFILRLDGHMALANTAALEIAGIEAETPSPDGGKIVKDDTGRPIGILKDNAMKLVQSKLPPPSNEEISDQFSRAQDHALSLGIVKVHAVTAYPTETQMLDWFQMARKKGLMKIRAFVSTPIEAVDQAVEDASLGQMDETLKWGGVKGLVDGSLGSGTAWMHAPFIDDPSNSGFPLNEPIDVSHWMKTADDAGINLSIHAIGDKAIDFTIDTMVDIAGDEIRDRRYRIEHFQHPSPDAIKRIAQFGIIASSHPYHAIDDGRWAGEKLDDERLASTYAFRSILDAGGIMTFGSDWPVAPLSPLKGIYAAVTRQTLDGANPEGWFPEQKISVEEALHAYTFANAYGFGEDSISGTLEAGKRADFIILSHDPREVDASNLNEISVLKTVIDGEIVYEAESR